MFSVQERKGVPHSPLFNFPQHDLSGVICWYCDAGCQKPAIRMETLPMYGRANEIAKAKIDRILNHEDIANPCTPCLD